MIDHCSALYYEYHHYSVLGITLPLPTQNNSIQHLGKNVENSMRYLSHSQPTITVSLVQWVDFWKLSFFRIHQSQVVQLSPPEKPGIPFKSSQIFRENLVTIIVRMG